MNSIIQVFLMVCLILVALKGICFLLQAVEAVVDLIIKLIRK